MTAWTFAVLAASALSLLALFAYIRRSAKAGDRILVAHGLILLFGLAVISCAVAALKVTGFRP